MTPPTIPDAGPLPVLSVSDAVVETTPQGIQVLAVRRPQVPLVQVRLHVPLGDVGRRDGASLRLLPKMLLAGTGHRSGSEVAATLQRLGVLAGAGADVDDLSVAAAVPAAALGEGLAEVADIVMNPSFPRRELLGERSRVVQDVVQEAADPIAVATHALGAVLFGRHPYADPLPAVTSVQRTGRATLSAFHEARVVPAGSVLVAVGDLDPSAVATTVAEAFAAWGSEQEPGVPLLEPPGAAPAPGPITVVHRPGAVQSNLRIGARCIGRHQEGFAALVLAVVILGGHFNSRLVTNLRERHGYTYSPRSVIDEHRLASAASVRAEVGTDVTAPALAEIRYELARLATTEVEGEELEAARRYLTGVLAMTAGTQSGLAGLLAGYAAQGLEPSYLERFTSELASVDAQAVRSAAARYLGPAVMSTVVVGDAAAVAASLEPLGEVTVSGS